MSRKRVVRPPLRDRSGGYGFHPPHVRCFVGAKLCRDQLAQLTVEAEAKLHSAATEEEALKAMLDGELERQALSVGAQVFAAMTVEGALNLLCLLLFGQEVFYREQVRLSLKSKLSIALPDDLPERVERLAELERLCDRLAEPRHHFVHPKPYEGEQRVRGPTESDLGSAVSAVADAKEFVELLQGTSVEHALALALW